MNMWLSRKQLSEEFGFSASTANNLFRDVSGLIGSRYPRQAIAGSRLNYIVAVDYLTFKKELTDKNMKKSVPPFNPKQIKELMLDGGEWTI